MKHNCLPIRTVIKNSSITVEILFNEVEHLKYGFNLSLLTNSQ